MVQKKCPPGVFCIENMTLSFLIILILVLLLYVYFTVFHDKKYVKKNKTAHHNNIQYRQQQQQQNQHQQEQYYVKPKGLYNNLSNDTFFNPHSLPLRQNPFLFNGNIESGVYKYNTGSSDPRALGIGGSNVGGRGGPGIQLMPINISTSHYNLQYRQVGILTREQGKKETILALFGRPLHSNRNKWQYYTMTDKNNMIKLPISKNGRSCTGEYGCDEVFNGDSVFVEGYKDAFTATIYESGSFQYIPL